MAREPPDYLSYLLRLWRARTRGLSIWRASLQSPQTGERMGFATLDDLFAYLREQAGFGTMPSACWAYGEGKGRQEKGAMIMSTEENKDVVRRWNSPEEHWALELLDESYANHSGTTAPWANIIQGLDEARARFDQVRQNNPTFRTAIEDIIAEGDKVAVRLTWYRGEKPYGNAMVFYRLKGGKIVDDWYCWTPLKEQ